MDRRRYTIEWLDAEILSGRFRLIVGDKAAIVFSIEPFPTGAADLHGQVAAGDLEEIARVLIPRAEQYGRAAGCIGATISSRPGWVRLLKRSGYATYQVSVRKEL